MNEQSLIKESLLAYRARYEAVAQVQAEERRQETVEQRWQKLNSMLQLAVALGWYERMRSQDVTAVRERWVKLKAGYK